MLKLNTHQPSTLTLIIHDLHDLLFRRELRVLLCFSSWRLDILRVVFFGSTRLEMGFYDFSLYLYILVDLCCRALNRRRWCMRPNTFGLFRHFFPLLVRSENSDSLMCMIYWFWLARRCRGAPKVDFKRGYWRYYSCTRLRFSRLAQHDRRRPQHRLASTEHIARLHRQHHRD